MVDSQVSTSNSHASVVVSVHGDFGQLVGIGFSPDDFHHERSIGFLLAILKQLKVQPNVVLVDFKSSCSAHLVLKRRAVVLLEAAVALVDGHKRLDLISLLLQLGHREYL